MLYSQAVLETALNFGILNSTLRSTCYDPSKQRKLLTPTTQQNICKHFMNTTVRTLNLIS